MADDIVERLRVPGVSPCICTEVVRSECKSCVDRIDARREIERLRAENESYYLLFTKLQDIAGDRRFSNEFVGQVTRRHIQEFTAATKDGDDQ